MHHTQKGFTLIELMIVVAIIGILAAIAIPQYQRYIARTQATSALQTLASLKTGVEFFLNQGATGAEVALGNLNIAANASPLGALASNFNDDGTGALTLTFDGAATPQLQGKILTLTRTAPSTWFCTLDVDEALRPSGCTLP